jgi:hypothetical protein
MIEIWIKDSVLSSGRVVATSQGWREYPAVDETVLHPLLFPKGV